MAFTGIRDLDIKIMNDLSDEDLHHFCQINIHINNICNDDNFWRRRLEQKFGQVPLKDYKNWKELYIYYMIQEKYGKYLGNIETIKEEKPSSVTVGEYYEWLNRFFEIVKEMHDVNASASIDVLAYKMEKYPGPFLASRWYGQIDNIDYWHGMNENLENDLLNYDRYIEVPDHKIVNPSEKKGLKDYATVNSSPTNFYVFIRELRISGYVNDVKEQLNIMDFDDATIENLIANAKIKPPSGRKFEKQENLPDISHEEAIMKKTIILRRTVDKTMQNIDNLIKEAAKQFEGYDKLRFMDEIRSKLKTYQDMKSKY